MDKSNNADVDPKFGEDIKQAYNQFADTVEHTTKEAYEKFADTVEHTAEDVGLVLEELGEVVKVTGRSLADETWRAKNDIWDSVCRFQEDCASNKGVLIFGAILGAAIAVGIAYGLDLAKIEEEDDVRGTDEVD